MCLRVWACVWGIEEGEREDKGLRTMKWGRCIILKINLSW